MSNLWFNLHDGFKILSKAVYGNNFINKVKDKKFQDLSVEERLKAT